MVDALQQGRVRWWALLRNQKPVYPKMPERGRQPIYVAFTLTVWTWTPGSPFLRQASVAANHVHGPRVGGHACVGKFRLWPIVLKNSVEGASEQ
jgi:hypothetical protein